MKVIIAGFEIDIEPTENSFGEDYKYHRVVKETEKAYQVEVNYYGGFGCKTYYKWVAKSVCKVDKNGDVFVPVWIV